MSATPSPPKVRPSGEERLRRQLATARRKYGAAAAKKLPPGQNTCPCCQGALPTKDLQLIRTQPVQCRQCGSVLFSDPRHLPEESEAQNARTFPH